MPFSKLSSSPIHHGRFLFMLMLSFYLLSGCGSGGSPVSTGGPSSNPTSGNGGGSALIPPTPVVVNQIPITVDGGPTGQVPDQLYVSVKVCLPGQTANCAIVDHVILDTGSSGLRLVASAIGNLAATLPPVINSNLAYAECLPFVTTSTWGSLRSADVYLGGEEAPGVSVQLIGDNRFSPPSSCGDGGLNLSQTVDALGGNGILGIGTSAHDCGIDCVGSAQNGVYFLCAQGQPTACGPAVASLAQQVGNPIAALQPDSKGIIDNNGSVISIQDVPVDGAPETGGSLILGIDTRDNNSLGSAPVLLVDPVSGELTTSYEGGTFSHSYVDSGTNALQVPTSTIPSCPARSNGALFACPGTLVIGSAVLSGSKASVSATALFQVNNATTLFSRSGYSAFDDLATVAAPTTGSVAFVWGAPFFFGRHVFTSIGGQQVLGQGTLPFVAFF